MYQATCNLYHGSQGCMGLYHSWYKSHTPPESHGTSTQCNTCKSCTCTVYARYTHLSLPLCLSNLPTCLRSGGGLSSCWSAWGLMMAFRGPLLALKPAEVLWLGSAEEVMVSWPLSTDVMEWRPLPGIWGGEGGGEGDRTEKDGSEKKEKCSRRRRERGGRGG